MADPCIFSSLPNAILDDILSRTSLKTVARCRLVCKELKHATYRINLSKLLSQRTDTLSALVFHSRHSRKAYFMHVVDNAKVGIKKDQIRSFASDFR